MIRLYNWSVYLRIVICRFIDAVYELINNKIHAYSLVHVCRIIIDYYSFMIRLN